MTASAETTRLRVRFTKVGKIRFLGHRDLARAWERAIRKVTLPVAYTEGFSPRPKVHFGLALSTGYESLAEYIDIDLRDAVDLDVVAEQLTAALPHGVEVTAVAVTSGGGSLQAVVEASTWRVVLEGVSEEALAGAAAAILDSEDVPVTIVRKGAAIVENLRPMVEELEVTGATEGGVGVRMTLACQPRSVRPSELLTAMVAQAPGITDQLTERRVRRDEQWMNVDGVRRPPVPAPAPPLAGAAAPA